MRKCTVQNLHSKKWPNLCPGCNPKSPGEPMLQGSTRPPVVLSCIQLGRQQVLHWWSRTSTWMSSWSMSRVQHVRTVDFQVSTNQFPSREMRGCISRQPKPEPTNHEFRPIPTGQSTAFPISKNFGDQICGSFRFRQLKALQEPLGIFTHIYL